MNREGRGKIGYLDEDWNPVVGCTNGCSYCWARRQAKRQRKNCQKCYAFTPHLHPERLDEPLRKRKPAVIGVAFMGDLFDPEINGEMLARCFEVMQACPRHTFVVLTKQAKRMRAECETFFENWFVRFPNGILPNVVLGVSVEDQASADRLIPELLKCAAATRIVSIEPMRGPVNLKAAISRGTATGVCTKCGWGETHLHENRLRIDDRLYCPDCRVGALDGVILGGQTGPGAVAMAPNWVRAVGNQCLGAGVPFFFKQWGEWGQVDSGRVGDIILDGHGHSAALCRRQRDIQPGGFHEVFMRRVGRKRAGRMLDGRTHDEVAWRTKGGNA